MADKEAKDDETNAPDRDESDVTERADDAAGAAEGERDASTRGVAKALGVDGEAEGEGEETAQAADAEEAEANPNRAARRREVALKRRAKRQKGEAVEGEGEAEAALPKDKNARAKELLRRRQLAAEGANTTQIGTSEMVQAQMVKASSSAAKWLKGNFKIILAVAAAGIIGFGAFTFFGERKAKALGVASDELIDGVEASQAPVLKEDKRTDDEKKIDPRPVFTTVEARADAAIAAYNKVIAADASSGPATLAKLGLAASHLEKGEVDKSLELFSAVSSSELAQSDIDVKARALEGLAFAKEAKKDHEGAVATFKELEKIAGFEDLAKYHQARVQFEKGDKEGAKTALLELRKKLEVPQIDNGIQSQDKALLKRVEDYIRTIDPEALPKKLDLGGGGRMTPEQLEAMQEQIRKLQEEMQKKQGQEGGEHEEHGGE